jgi:hypothetical protein
MSILTVFLLVMGAAVGAVGAALLRYPHHRRAQFQDWGSASPTVAMAAGIVVFLLFALIAWLQGSAP